MNCFEEAVSRLLCCTLSPSRESYPESYTVFLHAPQCECTFVHLCTQNIRWRRIQKNVTWNTPTVSYISFYYPDSLPTHLFVGQRGGRRESAEAQCQRQRLRLLGLWEERISFATATHSRQLARQVRVVCQQTHADKNTLNVWICIGLLILSLRNCIYKLSSLFMTYPKS